MRALSVTMMVVAVLSVAACAGEQGGGAAPGASSGTPPPSDGSPVASGTTSTPDGGTPGASGGTPGATGIVLTGSVTAAPGCPGPQRAESPCPNRPVSGAPVDLTAGGVMVASTHTDEMGRFRLVVAAGSYRITARNVGYASEATEDITVTGPLEVNLVVDSGLR